MKLEKLFKDIPYCQIKGSQDILLKGLTANSKCATLGCLFIAKKGQAFDGKAYISEAIQLGASAVLTDTFDALLNVVQVIHPSPHDIEPLLAKRYYQNAAENLLMIGITGTNGKTTTSFIIKYLLDLFYGPCGLIGTIEYLVGSHRYPANRTTPDVIENHKMLYEMQQSGARSAVMEVTSHALMQNRVDEIDFDVAVFSNLTLDHLDYHLTMENYCAAKSSLFQKLGRQKTSKLHTKWAVINADSPWSEQILKECTAHLLTYGIDQPADLKASHLQLNSNGTFARLTYQESSVDCFWPILGRFNVYNCLAAIAVLLTQGIPLENLIDKIAHVPSVKGRLEKISNQLGLDLYVDFAHTDDALKNVLKTLSEVKKGRLLTVFGCGGDRDRSKRPKMAKASEEYSDFTIVTSDNPRSENPYKICQEIAIGFEKSNSFIIEVDRKSAIQKAIEMALPGDMLLIAGKGHETYQILSHQTIEFDDAKIAAELCLSRYQNLSCLSDD
jgi:UDP-N-acetylmuramoyl-L-alanyl-D-glutamate--2,6-diaminopimelate ligase